MYGVSRLSSTHATRKFAGKSLFVLHINSEKKNAIIYYLWLLLLLPYTLYYYYYYTLLVDPSRVVSNRNAKTVYYNARANGKHKTSKTKRVQTRRLYASVTRDVCGILLCTRASHRIISVGTAFCETRTRRPFSSTFSRIWPTGTRTRRERVYRVRLRRRRGNTREKNTDSPSEFRFITTWGTDEPTSERLERAHLGWKTDAAAPARSAGPTVIREKRPFPHDVQYIRHIYVYSDPSPPSPKTQRFHGKIRFTQHRRFKYSVVAGYPVVNIFALSQQFPTDWYLQYVDFQST